MGDIDGYLERSFEFAQRQRQFGHADASDYQHIHIALCSPLTPRHRAEDECQVNLVPKRRQRVLDLIGKAGSFGKQALQFREQGKRRGGLVIHAVAVRLTL